MTPDSPRRYLELIDLTAQGTRNDISPLLRDAAAMRAMIADLIAPFERAELTHVAGIDALGFILGAQAALMLKVGFIPVRKGDKLPVPTFSREYIDDSGHFKRLEIRHDAIARGDRVLIVDDWIATGAQMKSAIALIEQTPATLVGVAALCIERHEKTARLRELYRCHDLWRHNDA